MQIGYYRPRFNRILRPSTLKTYVTPILLYQWNKQALGDQSKIDGYYLIQLIDQLVGMDMLNCGLEFTSQRF